MSWADQAEAQPRTAASTSATAALDAEGMEGAEGTEGTGGCDGRIAGLAGIVYMSGASRAIAYPVKIQWLFSIAKLILSEAFLPLSSSVENTTLA